MGTLQKILIDKKITPIFSSELILEFINVANRPKLKKYLTRQRIADTVRLIEKFGKEYSPHLTGRIAKDPKDNYLLEICYKAKPRYFVTGDKILLDLNRCNGTKIISFEEFISTI